MFAKHVAAAGGQPSGKATGDLHGCKFMCARRFGATTRASGKLSANGDPGARSGNSSAKEILDTRSVFMVYSKLAVYMLSLTVLHCNLSLSLSCVILSALTSTANLDALMGAERERKGLLPGKRPPTSHILKDNDIQVCSR